MKHFALTICSMAIVVIGGTGCSNSHSQSDAKAAELKAFDQEDVKLFTPYMTGDVEQARQSLKQTIQHLKASTVLDPRSQSGGLYVNYMRMYALEERTGHAAAARDALLLARYWRIRNMKLPEATNDADIIYVMSVTPEQILKYVDVLDAGDNGGRPKYLQYLTNSPAKTPPNTALEPTPTAP